MSNKWYEGARTCDYYMYAIKRNTAYIVCHYLERNFSIDWSRVSRIFASDVMFL